MNMEENSKTNESHKFALNLSQGLDLRKSNKRAAPQNLLFITCEKNIRKQYKNNKLKIIAPIWNDESELPDGCYSLSDIHDYIKYIIKKNEILTTIPPINVYINRIDNGLVFKIKERYKLELQTPETMKLFGSTEKLIYKTKNGEKVPIDREPKF